MVPAEISQYCHIPGPPYKISQNHIILSNHPNIHYAIHLHGDGEHRRTLENSLLFKQCKEWFLHVIS